MKKPVYLLLLISLFATAAVLLAQNGGDKTSEDALTSSILDVPCIDYPDPDKGWGIEALKWPNGKKLKVKFIDSGSSPKLCAKVMKYASLWSFYANLTFVQVSENEDADIRITFRGKGHWSQIGNASIATTLAGQKKPSMSLKITDQTSDDELRRVVLHEFGHAIGLMHEHQSPSADAIQWNREKVFEYYRGEPNKWSDTQIEDNILAHYDKSDFKGQYTSFDPKSIMCYPIPKGFANVVVGWNRNLSQTDIEFIISWYPK